MNIIDIQHTPFYQLPFRSSGRKAQVTESSIPYYKVRIDRMPEGITSFAVTSDLQGRECDNKNRLLGESVADSLASLVDKSVIDNIDVMLLGGDFYDYPDLRKLGGTGDVTSVLNAFANNFSYVISVLGNHDIVCDAELSKNVSILDGSVASYNGLNIGGVSGIIGNLERNQRKTESQYENCLDKILNKRPDIFLLHEGPDDPVNQQRGNSMIRNKIVSNKNGLILFGHSYWEHPYINIGNNHLLNTNRRIYIFVSDN